PRFALTFSHASQTARFAITNGLSGDLCSPIGLLPGPAAPVDRTNKAANTPAPSLRPHCKGFTTTTSRSASTPGTGTLTPRQLQSALVPHETARSLLITLQTSPSGPYSFNFQDIGDERD